MAEIGEPRPSILIIDDEKDVLYSFKRLLAGEPYELHLAKTAREGLEIHARTSPDLTLIDVRLQEENGLQVLKEIRARDPKALVIVMTAYSATQTAIEAMKAGAYDYILKPFEVGQIKELLRNAIRSAATMKSVVSYQPLLSREDYTQGIIGKSAAMQEVYKEIGRVAGTNVSVLITGETGTGKELAAKAIYHHSDRADKRFLAINCGGIPELLLESELFGYERGAFTGAYTRKIGKFEVCDGGTLLLDEIGELSLSTQTKLLRVLQENEIERLGGSTPIKVNVRIIAATHRDLRVMIRNKEFREDLYYRLNVVNVRMPSLRERKEDIPLLVEYFVNRWVGDVGAKVTVSEQAIQKLVAHDWPGNVRELENTLKNSLVRAKGQVLLPEDIHIGQRPDGDEPHPEPESHAPIRAAASGHVPAAPAGTPDLDGLMRAVFEEVRRRRTAGDQEDAFDMIERCLIRDALINARGNQAQAAKLLGITRSTLRKRMGKYGIQLRTNIEADSGS